MGFLRDGIPRKENGKIDFTPKRHHGHYLLLVILGFLLPPLAVAARFGIGKDFFINCVLTLCGYIPGHGHNFFVQNIRDNRNRGRTPKWAIRYGLVNDDYLKKQKKKRQWVGRYNHENSSRIMHDEDGNEFRYDRDHAFEDGDGPSQDRRRRDDPTLVEEERYYNEHRAGPSAHGGGDPYSLRRSSTSSSGAYGSGGAPGAGEAERRNARNKSRSRAFFGGKKADRHAKSGEVMGDPYTNGSSGFGRDESFSSSLDRHSFDEGPEDADARYRPGGGSGGGYGRSGGGGRTGGSSSGYGAGATSAPRRKDTASTSSSSRRVANDGLDHNF